MHNQDQSPPNENAPKLSASDIESLDRIFSDDPEYFISESDRDHGVLNLLDLLGTPVSSETQRTSRIDLIKILSSRLESAADVEDAQLSQADQFALDQYVENGYAVGGVEQELRNRAARCDQIANAITSTAAESSPDLVSRTLVKIQNHIDQDEAAMNFASPARGGFSLRWSDLISVAATLLLVASVTLPIMSGLRSNAQKTQCFGNMQAAANAFGLYTGSNRDMLPMATAGLGPTWMDVGSTPDRSNSSNLYTLIRTKLADLNDLACPSNPNAATGDADPNAWDWRSLKEISYSYRIMPPGGMRASSPSQPVRVVLLADRSPVILRVVNHSPVIPEENSPNHKGSGQHMLMLDGASIWAGSPVINDHDNIWLPRPIEKIISHERTRLGIIQGSEMPDGPTDAFVGP